MLKYKWLYEKLKQSVQNCLRDGIEKLPPEEVLCEQYKLSRQTVRQALCLLETDGLIVRVKGSGTYITGLLSDPGANKVAILLPNDREYLYPSLLFDLQRELTEAGFYTQLFTTNASAYEEKIILNELLQSPSFRGIIAEGIKTTLPNPNLDLYQKLILRGTKLVFLQNDYSLPDCPCIKDDNEGGSRILVRFLAEQGHTSPGAIFQLDNRQGLERYQGFINALQELGISAPDEHVVWYTTKELHQLEKSHDTAFLKNAIRDCFEECTAILCQNDEIAYWLNRELHLAGFIAPHEKTIASFDDSYLNHTEGVHFLSLSHTPHMIGNTAVKTLIKKMKGLPAASQIIPWELKL